MSDGRVVRGWRGVFFRSFRAPPTNDLMIPFDSHFNDALLLAPRCCLRRPRTDGALGPVGNHLQRFYRAAVIPTTSCAPGHAYFIIRALVLPTTGTMPEAFCLPRRLTSRAILRAFLRPLNSLAFFGHLTRSDFRKSAQEQNRRKGATAAPRRKSPPMDHYKRLKCARTHPIG